MFFVVNFRFSVWAKMWVSDLTHTVTHIGWQLTALPFTASPCPMGTPKGPERFKECRTERFAFLSGFFSLFYMTCSIKLPMV